VIAHLEGVLLLREGVRGDRRGDRADRGLLSGVSPVENIDFRGDLLNDQDIVHNTVQWNSVPSDLELLQNVPCFVVYNDGV